MIAAGMIGSWSVPIWRFADLITDFPNFERHLKRGFKRRAGDSKPSWLRSRRSRITPSGRDTSRSAQSFRLRCPRSRNPPAMSKNRNSEYNRRKNQKKTATAPSAAHRSRGHDGLPRDRLPDQGRGTFL